MFGIGGSEFIIIAIIALIFLGPDKLPEATKKLSRGIRELKKGSRTLQQTIENDEQIGGAIRDLRSAMRGEEPAPRPKKRKKKKKVTPDGATAPTENRIEGDAPAVAGEAGAGPIEAAAEATGEATADGSDALPEPKKPTVRMPPTAGEPDPDVRGGRPNDDDDDEELAAMIRPASGTIAKGAAVPAKESPKSGESTN